MTTTRKKTSKKKTKGRRSKETAPDASAEKAKREMQKQKREDLLAFRARMKKFGQELLRRRREALEESKRHKRIFL
jgi:hypothetical protein